MQYEGLEESPNIVYTGNCLNQPQNQRFIDRYQSRYGSDRVVSDAVAGAYTQPYLWRDLVDRCRTLNVPILKQQIAGTTFNGPAGTITLHENHHAFKPALIGRVNEHLQSDMMWQSPQWIKPLPWLGLEETEFSAREMIKEALVVYQQVLADS